MAQTPPRRAALIVNGKSRKGRAAFREACSLLKAQGFTLDSAIAVRDPRKLDDAVKQAVASGVPLVIVGGGDGSISAAVDHLVGHDTVFALLPLGTANSFARTLGLPLDVAGAIGAMARGQVRQIDLGVIDGDYFANCAALGISPLIAESVPHGLKKWFGRPGYLAWAAVKLARFKPFRLTVSSDAGSETLSALEVRIANGSHHGGTELVDTDVDNGEIVIQVVVGRGRSRLLWSWGLSLIDKAAAKGTLREFRGREFRIETDPRLPLSIDGEVLARTPITAAVARKAIRMIVPA